MAPREVRMPNVIQSLERGLSVLEFLNFRDGARIGEIADAVHVTRGTAYRILLTLSKNNFITKDAATGQHWLRRRVQNLSSGYESEPWLAEVVQPLLEERSAKLMWPLAVFTPQGEVMVCRVTTDYSSPVAMERWPAGVHVRMAASAAGLVYLAFCSPLQLAQTLGILRAQADSKSASALAPSRIDPILDRVRKQRSETWSKNVTYPSVSVPIFVNDGIFGSLNMRYFKSAVDRDVFDRKLMPALHATAKDLGQGIEKYVGRGTAAALTDTKRRA